MKTFYNQDRTTYLIEKFIKNMKKGFPPGTKRPKVQSKKARKRLAKRGVKDELFRDRES